MMQNMRPDSATCFDRALPNESWKLIPWPDWCTSLRKTLPRRSDATASRRSKPDPARHPQHDRVVWAFPVLPSYTLTHSWARELKRWRSSALVAVKFQIADDEPVFVGHYANPPMLVSAAEAVGIVAAAEDARGCQIMVPRRMARS